MKCENGFPMYFFEGVNIAMTRHKVLIVFCVERPSEEGAPLGWRNRATWMF